MGADDRPYIAENIRLHTAMSGNGGDEIRDSIRGIGVGKGKAILRISRLTL